MASRWHSKSSRRNLYTLAPSPGKPLDSKSPFCTTSWYMMASACMVSILLEMNRTVAVTAVDVKLVLVRTAGGLGEGGRKGQQIVGRAGAEAAGEQGARPGGVQLVGDDQIDAAPLQQAGGGANDGGGGFRRGQAIHDSAHPHVAKLLMVLHLGIQQDGPTARGAHAQKTRVGGRIESIQGGGVALGEQGVGGARALPDFVCPWGERGGEVARHDRQAAAQTECFHAQPASAGEGGGVERSEERRVGKEGRSRWSPYP